MSITNANPSVVEHRQIQPGGESSDDQALTRASRAAEGMRQTPPPAQFGRNSRGSVIRPVIALAATVAGDAR
jgi:hypothetical protein